MTTLYLIRHCEAYGNIYRRLDGIRDTDVTPLGREQIGYLSARFSGLQLDAVYSSALIRAVKTAAGVAAAAHAPHFIREPLHERMMGIYEGRSWYEVAALFPDIFRDWQNDFNDYVIPEGESYVGAGERFREALLELCRENEGKSVAVVAHSMVIKAFLERVLSPQSVPYGNNTAVSCIEAEPALGSFCPRFINDDSHLPEQMRICRQRWAKGGSKLEDYSLRYDYPQSDGSHSPVMLDTKTILIEAYERDDQVGRMLLVPEGEDAVIRELSIYPRFRRCGFATQLIGEGMYSTLKLGCVRMLYYPGEAGEGLASVAKRNCFLTKNDYLYKIM